jgi:F-type H+-transporting ATPase subunit epsilon
MAENFKFELVSPEKLLISANVNEVVVPGYDGDFTMLVRHAPMIATLRPGILRVPSFEGKERRFFVRGGFAEAGPDSLVVLAQQATPVEEFDSARINAEIRNAEEDLADAKNEDARRQAEDTLERLRTLKEALNLN